MSNQVDKLAEKRIQQAFSHGVKKNRENCTKNIEPSY